MFGSDILDAALGLIFVYLLLSLVMTALQEILAAWFKWRAKNLWHGIRSLLPAGQGSHDLAAAIYNHPLVKGMSRGDSKPSYIPSRTFVLALLESIVSAARPATPAAEAATTAPALTPFGQVADALEKLPDGDVKAALTALMHDSAQDLERFKLNIEVWYGQAADRMIGWYKRDTQTILLVLGFLVAAILNADSLQIGQKLYASPEKRAAILEKIRAFQDSPKDGTLRQTSASSQVTTPPANAAAAPGNGAAGSSEQQDLEKELTAAARNVTSSIQDVNATGLVGWRSSDRPRGAGDVLLKFAGLLLTALAVSLGAPFWFDLLNKFMNIRAAGKAPEEAPKSPKEEPQAQGPGGAAQVNP